MRSFETVTHFILINYSSNFLSSVQNILGCILWATGKSSYGVTIIPTVVPNIFMEDLEERALNGAKLRASMWVWYVDTFVLMPYGHSELQVFHQHLNKQNPSIVHHRRSTRKSTVIPGRNCNERRKSSATINLSQAYEYQQTHPF